MYYENSIQEEDLMSVLDKNQDFTVDGEPDFWDAIGDEKLHEVSLTDLEFE